MSEGENEGKREIKPKTLNPKPSREGEGETGIRSARNQSTSELRAGMAKACGSAKGSAMPSKL